MQSKYLRHFLITSERRIISGLVPTIMRSFSLPIISVDEDGNKDEYRTDMNFFVISDSEDSEENIGKEFFNLIIRNECKSSEGLGFDVDMVEETIEINVSETETKYLFNFWNSAPMPKDMVEWLINGITR